MTALDDPGRRRRRARLGRERRLDAGRLAPRPGALADRGVGAAPGRLHRGLPRRPGAEGALGLHPAVLAGRARPRRCCSPTTPAGCGGCCRAASTTPACPAEAVDEYVAVLSAPGALTAALNWYRAMSSDTRVDPVEVPTTYVWSDGDVAIGRTAAEACAQLRDRRLPVRGAARRHALDPGAGARAAGRRDPGPHRLELTGAGWYRRRGRGGSRPEHAPGRAARSGGGRPQLAGGDRAAASAPARRRPPPVRERDGSPSAVSPCSRAAGDRIDPIRRASPPRCTVAEAASDGVVSRTMLTAADVGQAAVLGDRLRAAHALATMRRRCPSASIVAPASPPGRRGRPSTTAHSHAARGRGRSRACADEPPTCTSSCTTVSTGRAVAAASADLVRRSPAGDDRTSCPPNGDRAAGAARRRSSPRELGEIARPRVGRAYG